MPASPLKGLDLYDWMDRFNVRYVDDPELEKYAAVHALTSLGRRRGLGSFDIWIHPDFKLYRDLILVHEAIENYLRRKGWSYRASHDYAWRKVYEMFGKTTEYSDLRYELRH